jgi:hypothetical protein
MMLSGRVAQPLVGLALPLAFRHCTKDHRHGVVRATLLRVEAEPHRHPPLLATARVQPARRRGVAMPWGDTGRQRCAIYTRKSSEEGLEQEFNSLAAQREACEAFIRSQRNEGWVLVRTRYDDGGFSGGSVERPALQNLIADIRAGRIDIVVVYKVDRLTRSLADFARLVELFDAEAVSFVSVTQQFNTTSSMGRLTLNMSQVIDFIVIIFNHTSFRRPTASLDGSWVE